MLDRFATARGLGFEAVECQLPYDHPAEELARACGDEKLRFVMFNASPPATWRRANTASRTCPAARPNSPP